MAINDLVCLHASVSKSSFSDTALNEGGKMLYDSWKWFEVNWSTWCVISLCQQKVFLISFMILATKLIKKFIIIICKKNPSNVMHDKRFFLPFHCWCIFNWELLRSSILLYLLMYRAEGQSAATLETRATCLDNDRERKVIGVLWADEKEMLGGSWAVNQVSSSSTSIGGSVRYCLAKARRGANGMKSGAYI